MPVQSTPANTSSRLPLSRSGPRMIAIGRHNMAKPEPSISPPEREIVLKFPSIEMSFTGEEYVNEFVLPNLFFHTSIAYALLRHNGMAA